MRVHMHRAHLHPRLSVHAASPPTSCTHAPSTLLLCTTPPHAHLLAHPAVHACGCTPHTPPPHALTPLGSISCEHTPVAVTPPQGGGPNTPKPPSLSLSLSCVPSLCWGCGGGTARLGGAWAEPGGGTEPGVAPQHPTVPLLFPPEMFLHWGGGCTVPAGGESGRSQPERGWGLPGGCTAAGGGGCALQPLHVGKGLPAPHHGGGSAALSSWGRWVPVPLRLCSRSCCSGPKIFLSLPKIFPSGNVGRGWSLLTLAASAPPCSRAGEGIPQPSPPPPATAAVPQGAQSRETEARAEPPPHVSHAKARGSPMGDLATQG